MRKTRIRKFFFILILGLLSLQSYASEPFLSGRCETPFPESILDLREFIENKGYTISRVQRVDIGLRERGYKTGLFRVVFFGKNSEIQYIRKNYPNLIPYIPLSITVFEDGEYTNISAVNPDTLRALYDSEKIKSLMDTWSSDVRSIFKNYNEC